MNNLPTLYKRTNLNQIEQWGIVVNNNVITITHGLVNGKLQTTTDTIKEGKNVGKGNETTAIQQAEKEAAARHLKQIKKGFVTSIELAQQGKVDSTVIEGGILPMLSINKSHPKDPILDKYLKFPCIIQPKLDGTCCIAIVEYGKATLWSRTRKRINCLPHIIKELEKRFPKGKIILHGECYNHDYKDHFQDLMSIIRNDAPDSEGLFNDIELHVYDLPECNIVGLKIITDKSPYWDRYLAYKTILNPNYVNLKGISKIIPVHGYPCNNKEELLKQYEVFLSEGYEGGMAKNTTAPYESGKRSYNILKMKEFASDEGIVIGVEEGRGKENNAVGSFLCMWKTFKDVLGKKDVTFKVRMKCTLKQKQEMFVNQKNYIGKQLTFTYKRLTDDGKPYIPIGKGFSPDRE